LSFGLFCGLYPTTQVKQTKRTYTAEEKENAVNTARELRNTALAGRKLNIGYSLLCGWIKAAEKAENQGKTLVESVTENKELLELRKKNKELEEELEEELAEELDELEEELDDELEEELEEELDEELLMHRSSSI
jgi:transposase-like protein